MTTKKAFERLAFTISKQNKPNQTDLEALKVLAEYFDNYKKEVKQENNIFAKLFVYTLSNELEFYQDIKFAQMKLNQVMNKSTVEHYNDFNNTLNSIELEKFKKHIGYSEKHPLLTLNDNEYLKDNALVKERQKELFKFINGINQIEDTEKNLDAMITEFIIKYRATPWVF